jgi:hypothetical protein
MADNSYSVSVVLKGTNQLSTPVNQAQQSLKGLSQEAGRTNQAMSQLKTVGMGLFAGASLAGVARMAEELYTSGMEAQRAGNLFRSFGAQVGDTDALLARLRTTTRGVVTDIDLMNAASSMMSMGLAKNATDVERLTNIGVTFAQAMGTDVGASLENLNMILANQSYLRLDSLGISSAQVRELANQYKAAGMDSSEAFNAAFLDVAEGKLPQMAAVADATVTEFQKLQTSMDNFWADFGERFAQGVNGLIGIAEAGGIAIQSALFGDVFGQATARGQGDSALSDIAKAMAAQGGGLQNWSNIRQIMAGSLNAGVTPGQLTAEQLRALFPNTPTDGPVMDEALRLAARGMLIYQQELSGIQVGSRGAAGDYLYGANSPYRTDIGYSTPVVSRTPQWYDQLTASGQLGFGINPMSPGDRYAGQQNYRSYLWQNMNNFGSAIGGVQRGSNLVSDSVFFTDDEIQRAQTNADVLQRTVDLAEQWNSLTGQDMVSDTDLTKMQGMAEAGQAWADSMQRASEVDLSTLFGQTSGGQFDQVNQAVLDQLRAGGATAEQLQSAEQQMGMRSGTMTGMSVQFDNQIKQDLADIWTQLGPDAYFAAQQSIIDSWRDIRTENPDYTGTAPWDLAMRNAGINQQQGSAYTVQAGDTVWDLSRAAGMSVQEYMAANGLDSTMLSIGQQIGSANTYSWDPTAITTAMDEAATSSTTISDNMTTAADTLQSGIDAVFGKSYQLPIELVISAVGKDVLSQLIASIVQGNGGTVPGSSTNTGRSNAGSRNDGNRTRGR